MDSCRQESFIDSGLLNVLSVQLDAPMKCDILYSLLASRLMASSKFPDISDSSQWHSSFLNALERCAWTLRREQLLQPSFEHQPSVTLNDVITQVMASAVFQDHRELAGEALASLARLPIDSPIRIRLQERHVSERTVKLPDGGEERRFTVHLLLALSTRNACIDVFYLEFETTQSVGEQWLQQTFSTSSFTSTVTVKHHSFELAARAFARSRKQLVTFVGEHQLLAVRPSPGLSKEHWACGAVMAPDNPSPQ
ncbi:hypothetical protein ACYZTL_12440 [Pseudomonas sp. LB3P81]